MKEIKGTVYQCDTCGCLHVNEMEIIHFAGYDFCTDCIDEYKFYEDPTYGVIVLPAEKIFSIAQF